jgi:negative regulator of sigma E activity
MAKDTLSAIFDGECSPAELDRFLDEFEQSPELKQAWSRMCLSRDATEGVHVRAAQRCICSDVMGSIDAEPTSFGAKVVPIVRRRLNSYWKPAIGLAAAASFGAIAVSLNFSGHDSVGGGASPGLMPQVTSPVSMPIVSQPARNLRTVSATPQDLQQMEQDDDLRAYLIEHSSAIADRGMGGALSYARFAAHTGDQMLQPVSLETQP